MKENFQIIGIRPLKGCDKKFRKVLKAEQFYLFDKRYNLDFNSKNEITGIRFDTEKVRVPKNFYSNKLNIQINAIVGGNGSGKSALAELFLYFMFYYGLKKELISKHQFPTDSKGGRDTFDQVTYTTEIRAIKFNLNVELLYIHDNLLYQVILVKGEFKIRVFKHVNNSYKSRTQVLFKNFVFPFYSMYVNYSHYALNTNVDGLWLRTLFHKNDGYQLPVVINPYREEGNIDINNENYLSRDRVFTNVIDTGDNTLILPYLKIDYIEVTKDVSKKTDGIYPEEIRKKNKELIVKPLYKVFFKGENYPNSISKYQNEVEDYILRKIRTITERYSDYKQYNYLVADPTSNEIPDKDELNKFFSQIYKYRSHVTLKIRQSLNFLRQDIYQIDHNRKEKSKKFELDEIIANIEKLKGDDFFTETIDYLPPPIFMTRFHFKDKSHFDQLSSGEKQQIYSIHSIIYHLKNLESVHSSSSRKLTYNSVFFILDEIELYYHPKAQKKTIDRLLYVLEKIKLDKVKYLNIMFLTHSPFILSDIPSALTMKLKEGAIYTNDEKQKTFAANITDLLTDSFFLDNGLIGDFAKRKLEETINWINENHEKIKENKNFNLNVDEYEYYKKIIAITDEPVLHIKLNEMLLSLRPDDIQLKIDNIDEQIKQLDKEKEELKKGRDDIS